MRKILLAFVAMTVIFTACKKEVPQAPVADTVEVEFVIDQTDFGGLKSTDNVPLCNDLPWSYVKFIIHEETTNTDTPYTSEIIHMMGGDEDGLTQVVKLPVKDPVSGVAYVYTLTSFLVYSDVLPIGPVGDVIVRAAPAEPTAGNPSEYWDLMTHKLDLPIVVEGFKKKQIIIDVLCFEDVYYEAFGFFWFEMNDVRIEKQCFFGDVCTGKLADFEGSLYASQSQGVQMDMPAIMKVEVLKEDTLTGLFKIIKEFTNDTWQTPGEGDCMEVYWANDLSLEENFQFNLYVWLPFGNTFKWKLIDDSQMAFTDDGVGLKIGDDGVIDFTVGNCNIYGADYVYPAFMDIPDYSVTFDMTLQNAAPPRPHGAYVEALFYGIPAGFDISDGTYGGWCGDKAHTITAGITYKTRFINSILPLPTGFDRILQPELNKLNWLFNHLEDYFPGINLADFADYSGSGYSSTDWSIIQDAVWNITNTYGATGKAKTLSDAAISTFKPIPGDYAAILMESEKLDGSKNVQVLFIMIDP